MERPLCKRCKDEGLTYCKFRRNADILQAACGLNFTQSEIDKLIEEMRGGAKERNCPFSDYQPKTKTDD